MRHDRIVRIVRSLVLDDVARGVRDGVPRDRDRIVRRRGRLPRRGVERRRGRRRVRFIGAQIDGSADNARGAGEVGRGRHVGVVAPVDRLRACRERIIALRRVRKERLGGIVADNARGSVRPVVEGAQDFIGVDRSFGVVVETNVSILISCDDRVVNVKLRVNVAAEEDRARNPVVVASSGRIVAGDGFVVGDRYVKQLSVKIIILLLPVERLVMQRDGRTERRLVLREGGILYDDVGVRRVDSAAPSVGVVVVED